MTDPTPEEIRRTLAEFEGWQFAGNGEFGKVWWRPSGGWQISPPTYDMNTLLAPDGVLRNLQERGWHYQMGAGPTGTLYARLWGPEEGKKKVARNWYPIRKTAIINGRDPENDTLTSVLARACYDAIKAMEVSA